MRVSFHVPPSWNNPPRLSPGMITPMIARSHGLRDPSDMVCEGLKERDRHGDDGVIFFAHPEAHGDESLTIIINERADFNGVRSNRGDDEFSHISSFRAGADDGTIADGGAAARVVRRAPGRKGAAA